MSPVPFLAALQNKTIPEEEEKQEQESMRLSVIVGQGQKDNNTSQTGQSYKELCSGYEEFLLYLCQMLDLNSVADLQALVFEWLQKNTQQPQVDKPD